MTTVFRRTASALFPALLFLGGCASAPTAPRAYAPGELPHVVTPADVPAGAATVYSRSLQTEPDSYQLQTGLRVFRPAQGPEVVLLGAVHIGEPDYYGKLQDRMDAADLVLYELVTDETKPAESLTAEEKAEKTDESAYGRFARLVGLSVQTSHIHYKRPNFERCDMTMQQLNALLEKEKAEGGEKGKKASEALRQFSKLRKQLEGDSWLLNFAFWVAGMSDTIKAELKLMLVFSAGGSSDQMEKALPPRLKQLITEDRNDHAMADLTRIVRERPNLRRIVVFYGAAHLPGMEKALLAQGYQPAGPVEWLSAVSSHPFAEGLDQDDIDRAIRRVTPKAKTP